MQMMKEIKSAGEASRLVREAKSAASVSGVETRLVFLISRFGGA